MTYDNLPDGTDRNAPTLTGHPDPVIHGLRECHHWIEVHGPKEPNLGDVIACVCGEHYEYGDWTVVSGEVEWNPERWESVGTTEDLEPEQIERLVNP